MKRYTFLLKEPVIQNIHCYRDGLQTWHSDFNGIIWPLPTVHRIILWTQPVQNHSDTKISLLPENTQLRTPTSSTAGRHSGYQPNQKPDATLPKEDKSEWKTCFSFHFSVLSSNLFLLLFVAPINPWIFLKSNNCQRRSEVSVASYWLCDEHSRSLTRRAPKRLYTTVFTRLLTPDKRPLITFITSRCSVCKHECVTSKTWNVFEWEQPNDEFLTAEHMLTATNAPVRTTILEQTVSLFWEPPALPHVYMERLKTERGNHID